MAVLAPDYVGYCSAMPEPVRGPEGFAQMFARYIRPAFPDQRITVDHEVAAGNRIAVQVTWTATHQGAFVGIPATGRRITVAGTGIFRIAGDLIAEEWMQEDFLDIWQQFGQPQSPVSGSA